MQNCKVERMDNSPRCFLGQSPHWDNDRKQLYYTDNQAGTIHKYDQNNDRHNMTKIREY